CGTWLFVSGYLLLVQWPLFPTETTSAERRFSSSVACSATSPTLRPPKLDPLSTESLAACPELSKDSTTLLLTRLRESPGPRRRSSSTSRTPRSTSPEPRWCSPDLRRLASVPISSSTWKSNHLSLALRLAHCPVVFWSRRNE
ncbi:hypothetical protein PRIPAC_77153, partial [Pristionchus pacificus]